MLPVAAGANGQPPMPPRLASSVATPACTAANAFARPVLRVLWKWQRKAMPRHRLADAADEFDHLGRHADADGVGERDLERFALGDAARNVDDPLHGHLALERAAKGGRHGHLGADTGLPGGGRDVDPGRDGFLGRDALVAPVEGVARDHRHADFVAARRRRPLESRRFSTRPM